MESLALWEQLLIGAFAVLFLLWGWPRARAMLKDSEEQEKDWAALLLPIGAVVLFVFLLLSLA